MGRWRNLGRMTFGPLRERGLRETWRSIRACAAARRLEEIEAFDRRFGTDTARSFTREDLLAEGDDVPKLWRYWPTLPRRFGQLMGEVEVTPERCTFVDLGSGKGRVLMMASHWPFQRIVGVELCPSLHAIAEQNLARYRSPSQRCRAFDLVCADAARFSWPRENLLVYLFQPFPAETMRATFANLRAAIEGSDREVAIAYLNPIFHEVITASGFALARRRSDDSEGFGWAIYRRA
jgi:hypothetical protein